MSSRPTDPVIIAQERLAVIREAHSWLRTPYAHLQRVKGAGVDCATILAEVYGAAVPWCPEIPVEYYPQDWHLHKGCGERYLAVVESYCEQTPFPEPGDIVVFRFGHAFSHGAIIVEWPTVIHAYIQASGVTLEDVEANKELAGRVRRFYSPWRVSHGVS